MSNRFPSDPYGEATRRQNHGGFKSPFLGGLFQHIGQAMQKTPPSMKFRKIPIDVAMTVGGKMLEDTGKRVSVGLPQDRSKFDILHHDMGYSQPDTLEILRRNSTGNR